jgi:hypothetical protein
MSNDAAWKTGADGGGGVGTSEGRIDGGGGVGTSEGRIDGGGGVGTSKGRIEAAKACAASTRFPVTVFEPNVKLP